MSRQFQPLSQQFDTLVEKLNGTQDHQQRKQLLLRMKIVLDEIDALASTLPQDTTSSLPPDQPTT
jgi:hypothetical protein